MKQDMKQDANTRRKVFLDAAAGTDEAALLDSLHDIADAAGYKVGNPVRGAFCTAYLASFIINNNQE